MKKSKRTFLFIARLPHFFSFRLPPTLPRPMAGAGRGEKASGNRRKEHPFQPVLFLYTVASVCVPGGRWSMHPPSVCSPFIFFLLLILQGRRPAPLPPFRRKYPRIFVRVLRRLYRLKGLIISFPLEWGRKRASRPHLKASLSILTLSGSLILKGDKEKHFPAKYSSSMESKSDSGLTWPS